MLELVDQVIHFEFPHRRRRQRSNYLAPERLEEAAGLSIFWQGFSLQRGDALRAAG